MGDIRKVTAFLLPFISGNSLLKALIWSYWVVKIFKIGCVKSNIGKLKIKFLDKGCWCHCSNIQLQIGMKDITFMTQNARWFIQIVEFFHIKLRSQKNLLFVFFYSEVLLQIFWLMYNTKVMNLHFLDHPLFEYTVSRLFLLNNKVRSFLLTMNFVLF